MRTEPSISPLTLSICCAVVAGALALAPGRDAGPMGFLRGGDVVALEAESMNPGPGDVDEDLDEAVAAGVGLETPTEGRAEPPSAEAVAPACVGDCPEGPAPIGPDRSGTTPAGGPADGSDADGSGGTSEAGRTDGSATDGTAGTTDGTDGVDDDDSCRSRRAVAVREDGPADVARPSPCSHGRIQGSCGASSCDDRSRGTREA